MFEGVAEHCCRIFSDSISTDAMCRFSGIKIDVKAAGTLPHIHATDRHS
jgi:hypothetical protein